MLVYWTGIKPLNLISSEFSGQLRRLLAFLGPEPCESRQCDVRPQQRHALAFGQVRQNQRNAARSSFAGSYAA